MMPLTGHVATTVLPNGEDTHTVEYSDGELATERDADTEDDLLGVAVGIKPAVLDADRDTLRDGVTVGVTILHWA